jgi:hypothetical protein
MPAGVPPLPADGCRRRRFGSRLREPDRSRRFEDPGFVLEYLHRGPGPLRRFLLFRLMDVAVGPDGTGWGIGATALTTRSRPGTHPVFDIAATRPQT